MTFEGRVRLWTWVNATFNQATRSSGASLRFGEILKGRSMLHAGSCICGAIEVEVTGRPEAMGYCHCDFCRSYSGNPFSAFSMWKPDAVRIKAGSQNVMISLKPAVSQRKYCARCGGYLMTYHSTLDLVDMLVSTLPTLAFSPSIHVNYAETVLPVRDGLPKLKDFPQKLGGSGEMIAE
jgi:hypothetical protein